MNEIVNKVLFAEDKLMAEIRSRKPDFMHSACERFTNKQRKNTKIQRNGKLTFFLPKLTR